ncbi:MAG: hypothetical protein SGJ21_00545 [Alphaproteobacteria bacterium]|nr:hypothetical protein [Alphaproteobacteria bacterium]
MFDIDLTAVFHALAALFAGAAAASGWTAAVIVANTAFDGLDRGRADRHLQRVLVATAGFQTALLCIAAGFALVSAAHASLVTAGVAALGFFSNIWTLAPRRDRTPEGLRKKSSTRRVVAVSLTLIMTAVALTSAVFAAFGI